jgi:hypothetical protein
MQTSSSFKGIPLRHRDKDLPGVTILDASKPRKQKISGVDDGHFDVSGILETWKLALGKARVAPEVLGKSGDFDPAGFPRATRSYEDFSF